MILAASAQVITSLTALWHLEILIPYCGNVEPLFAFDRKYGIGCGCRCITCQLSIYVSVWSRGALT